MIAQTAAARQWPRPPKLAHGVGHSVPKRKFRTGRQIRCGITLYICSEQIYVTENLPPRRRPADDIAVCADGDLIRQLMLQGEIRRYVSTISRITREFRATVGMRIENHDLFAEFVTDQLDWANEISIVIDFRSHIKCYGLHLSEEATLPVG